MPCCVGHPEGLADYVGEISANFEIAQHFGKSIAAWDHPRFVAAGKATHMRETDYVVGLIHHGHARAYPLWITDYYHIINDHIGGHPLLFCTCERCQSGSAFVPVLDGQPVRFSAFGMYNASLTMVNRPRRKPAERPSLWLHYEGIAIHGPRKGQSMEQVPTFHATWADWRTMHPDTDVMVHPNDPRHTDGRHGHGREEFFGRPGMDAPLASTITGRFDTRYVENELTLGLNLQEGVRGYPLLEVQREGGAVNDRLGPLPVVVFAGPRPEQCTMAAYSPVVDGRVLRFANMGVAFRDEQTGSEWTIEGVAVAGAMAGRRLEPLRWQYVRWHAWVYPHPRTELFLSDAALPRYPNFPETPQLELLRPVLDALARNGADLSYVRTVLELRLPHEAVAGVTVLAGGDRLNVYRFGTRAAARDYVALGGAWFCMPLTEKLGRKPAHAAGIYVVDSDPEIQWAEPSQTVRYPDRQVDWSQWVTDRSKVERWAPDVPQDEPDRQDEPVCFMELVAALKARRHDVVEVAFLPHSQLRPGCLSAISATLDAGRFAIYRCADERSARHTRSEIRHALRCGQWVFRSIPWLMFEEPRYEMIELPDDRIAWSPLLGDRRFHAALEEILGAPVTDAG